MNFQQFGIFDGHQQNNFEEDPNYDLLDLYGQGNKVCLSRVFSDDPFDQEISQDRQSSQEISSIKLSKLKTFEHGSLQQNSISVPEMEDFSNPFIPGKNYPYDQLDQKDEKIKVENKDETQKSTRKSLHQNKHSKKQKIRSCKNFKNQTKNIPKNFGKAILSYIIRMRRDIQPILQAEGITFVDFNDQLQMYKKKITTIENLRSLWTESKYSKIFRILSNRFLKKYALQYIFNSRIINYCTHIKYRTRIQQALRLPSEFKHIKDF